AAFEARPSASGCCKRSPNCSCCATSITCPRCRAGATSTSGSRPGSSGSRSQGGSAAESFDRVNDQLIPNPDPSHDVRHPRPLAWLRQYSNYLTPRRGVFSGDTWAAIIIWLRNTLLIQLILVSGLLGLLMIPHLWAPPDTA